MVPTATATNYKGIKWYILYFIFLLYSKISIIIVKMSSVCSYYNLITEEKKRILLFCNKIEDVILYVCGRWWPHRERSRCSYLYVHFDLFLITFLFFFIKTSEKSYRNTNKKLHPFSQINTSFVSQKIQNVLCLVPLTSCVTIHLSSNVCPSYTYDLCVGGSVNLKFNKQNHCNNCS